MGKRTPVLTNADIDIAFAEGEFACVYQPKLDLASGDLRGAEALVRWHHNRLGELPPGVFLSYLNQQGRLQELTRFVFQRATNAAARLRAQGEIWPIHVNLCAEDLRYLGLARYFEMRLRHNDLPSDCIRLELSEKDMNALTREGRGRLMRLLSFGFTLAVQGPSDEVYKDTEDIPVAEFQLRGPALLGLAQALSETGSGRVMGMVRAAKRLGREVTAIGLESLTDIETARALGFDSATGFALARPMPLADLCDWVANRPGLVGPVPDQAARRLS